MPPDVASTNDLLNDLSSLQASVEIYLITTPYRHARHPHAYCRHMIHPRADSFITCYMFGPSECLMK
ncbi:hypothetical protein Tcan_09989 [Toxocara canis]|uniref:Uncharacterized protein n=1 Tax=Toxocara canis TaxID=6265 RepID=A0A0B2UVJ7_TOXCA|nr:hypothetical protein Tcan_09989 [Toxocara canis]